MPHSTATLNTQAAAAFGAGLYTYGALGTGSPTATSFGAEVSGGSPAYARIASTAGSSSGGSNTASQQTFNVGSGTTVTAWGGFSAITAGTYAGYATFGGITFSSQGNLSVTPTIAQS